jgi:two-component system phosphate regulon response regulator OmpR
VTKILIADDSPAESRLTETFLDRAGFSCVAIHDPMRLKQAIDSEQPSLILLEVVMPQRNGFQPRRDLKGPADEASKRQSAKAEG